MIEAVGLIERFGFPIVAAVGMAYLVFFVYKWVTTEIRPVISTANSTLIGLIDRIRLLDQDMIRLQEKVETVIHLRNLSFDSDNQKALNKSSKE
jgi:hypothetical protein